MTHGLTYLKDVDNIYVINEGRISESGTYKQLLERKGAFADILMTYLSEKVAEEEEVDGEELVTHHSAINDTSQTSVNDTLQSNHRGPVCVCMLS